MAAAVQSVLHFAVSSDESWAVLFDWDRSIFLGLRGGRGEFPFMREESRGSGIDC